MAIVVVCCHASPPLLSLLVLLFGLCAAPTVPKAMVVVHFIAAGMSAGISNTQNNVQA